MSSTKPSESNGNTAAIVANIELLTKAHQAYDRVYDVAPHMPNPYQALLSEQVFLLGAMHAQEQDPAQGPAEEESGAHVQPVAPQKNEDQRQDYVPEVLAIYTMFDPPVSLQDTLAHKKTPTPPPLPKKMPARRGFSLPPALSGLAQSFTSFLGRVPTMQKRTKTPAFKKKSHGFGNNAISQASPSSSFANRVFLGAGIMAVGMIYFYNASSMPVAPRLAGCLVVSPLAGIVAFFASRPRKGPARAAPNRFSFNKG